MESVSYREIEPGDVPELFAVRTAVRENGHTRREWCQLGITETSVRAMLGTSHRGLAARRCFRSGRVRVGRRPHREASDKDQTLLGDLAIPTRSFTADVSVFEGTPPAKPWDCKVGLNRAGALGGDRRAEPTGGEPRLSHTTNGIGARDIA